MILIFSLIDAQTPWLGSQAAANVFSLLSAIGTIGAFLYAFHLERRNSKKINDLAEITKNLSEQNRLILEQNELQKKVMKAEVAPDFSKPSVEYDGLSLNVSIKNSGGKATVTKIEYDDSDASFYRRVLPLVIKSDETATFRSKEMEARESDHAHWEFRILYHDIYLNKFEIDMNGHGKTCSQFKIYELTETGRVLLSKLGTVWNQSEKD